MLPGPDSASAFVQRGRLHVFGLIDTPVGALHGYAVSRVPPDVADGLVDIGSDDLHPAVASKIKTIGGPLMANAIKTEVRDRAIEIVDRARAGDQNAMAVIVCTREAARHGNPRAILAVAEMTIYAKRTTGKQGADFGWFGSKIARSVSRGVRQVSRTVSKAARVAATPLHYGAAIASVVPGVGTSVAATLGAASALASGKSITDAVIEGAASSIPGGALASGMVATAAKGVVHGKSLANIVRDGTGQAARGLVRQAGVPDFVIDAAGKRISLPRTATNGDLVKLAAKYSGNRAVINALLKRATPSGKKSLQVGFALGTARRLQHGTSADGSIRAISSRAAWELGE